MKNIIYKIVPILLLIYTNSIYGQNQLDNYYYYKGEKIPLSLNTTTISVFSADARAINNINIEGTGLSLASTSEMQRDLSSKTLNKPKNFESKTPIRYWKEVVFSNRGLSEKSYAQRIETLKSKNKNIIVSPYFKKGVKGKIGLSNYFYVKLKHQDGFKLLLEQIEKYGLELIGYNKFMPLWFTVSVTPNSKNTLQMANTFYETGYFADIDPAFMFNFRGNCKNDSNFNQLWGLENSVNSNLDINACNAWTITEGNGVNVAVLDQGVHKPHNDLNANISALSYDTQNGSSPSVFTNGRDHGTHVSGTIAAQGNNNLQVVGVAPQSEIMSISHTLSLTPNVSQELADGINWAWQNGADVINNSWGDQGGAFYGQLQSALLENALTNALNLGRSGLGTVVVFAAGNTSPAIDYPASFHDDILCTGAMTSTGTRSNFSGFGGDLDLVAPGSAILSTIPGNGTASWNGTSMAAPHVAGVAALVISVDNNLTNIDINNIIEQSAQKVRTDIYTYGTNGSRPNGTWNSQMGYGLLDAYQAVLLAQSGNCPSHLTITQNVNAGQSDIQEAINSITATNTIFNNATAQYDAGNKVLLKTGFHARNGATFNAYIEGCNSRNSEPKEKVKSEVVIVYEKIKINDNTKKGNKEIIKAFPNPVKDLITIKSEEQISSWELNNYLGKQVDRSSPKKNAFVKDRINVSSLNSGFYILKIQLSDGRISYKNIIKN